MARTEIVEPADSTPVFGEHARIRLGTEVIPIVWDAGSRNYVARIQDWDQLRLRVARLKGDTYIVQVAPIERALPEPLIQLFRYSSSGEVIPLDCAVTENTAARFGVRLGIVDGTKRELIGDRAAVLGLLAFLAHDCTALFRVSEFAPPVRELASEGTGPGRRLHGNCVPCPTRNGACVQGAVRDDQEGALPGVTITATASGSSDEAATETDARGDFLLTGLAPGVYQLAASLSGFATALVVSPVHLGAGSTYVFDTPIELPLGEEGAIIELSRPIECN